MSVAARQSSAKTAAKNRKELARRGGNFAGGRKMLGIVVRAIPCGFARIGNVTDGRKRGKSCPWVDGGVMGFPKQDGKNPTGLKTRHHNVPAEC